MTEREQMKYIYTTYEDSWDELKNILQTMLDGDIKAPIPAIVKMLLTYMENCERAMGGNDEQIH